MNPALALPLPSFVSATDRFARDRQTRASLTPRLTPPPPIAHASRASIRPPRRAHTSSSPFPEKNKKIRKAYRAARGDAFARVAHVLNRRLQRTGKPFDLYGLYRAVTVRGGFGSRPLARRHLNMMRVFREMRNHYDKHTYTDIGTQLLNTYEVYFLDYERDHPQDLNVAACPRCGRAPPRRPPLAIDRAKQSTAKEATAGDAAAGDETTAPVGAASGAAAPFGGVAWAGEGVTDADLRDAAAARPPETTSPSPHEPRKAAFAALLPLGWVECDVCRVLTHVACARDGAADVTPGNQVAWFVCDACDAKARGVEASAGESPRCRRFAGRPETSPSPRGKSPLGSRRRVGSDAPRGAPRRLGALETSGASKRDRHGREVRPSPWPMPSPCSTDFVPGGADRRGAYRAEFAPAPVPVPFVPAGSGAPFASRGSGALAVSGAVSAYGASYPNAEHQARDVANAHAAMREDAYGMVEARAVYGDCAAYDAAAAAAAAAAERARAPSSTRTDPGGAFAVAASDRTHHTYRTTRTHQTPFQAGSGARELSRRALGSVPGARLRRSNSAQNILNAARAREAGFPADPARSGGSPSPPEDARHVDALTRSASQCSLGAEHFWRGLLGANPAQDDAENDSVGPEGGGDLYAFA